MAEPRCKSAMGQAYTDRNGEGADALLARLCTQLAGMGFTFTLSADPAARILHVGNATLWWQYRDHDVGARIAALNTGIDDVIGPWMDPRETLARILRLTGRASTQIICGDLHIGLLDRNVARAGQPIPLLSREYALLLHLARAPGCTFSRNDLLKSVWRLVNDPGTNSVEVHMSRLRAKVDRGFAWPMLHTVKGAGYMLMAEQGCAR